MLVRDLAIAISCPPSYDIMVANVTISWGHSSGPAGFEAHKHAWLLRVLREGGLHFEEVRPILCFMAPFSFFFSFSGLDIFWFESNLYDQNF